MCLISVDSSTNIPTCTCGNQEGRSLRGRGERLRFVLPSCTAVEQDNWIGSL